jgi:hypothetical protein
MWLKSKTNNQFIVIEKVHFRLALTDQFLGSNFKERWDLERIKKLI